MSTMSSTEKAKVEDGHADQRRDDAERQLRDRRGAGDVVDQQQTDGADQRRHR
jgi:hypothetical protein